MHKVVIDQYHHQVWNQKKTERVFDLFHPDAVIHSALGKKQGPEAMHSIVNTWLQAFPDLKVVPVHTLEEGSTVIAHWESHGTHQGIFRGIEPSERHVSYGGVTIFQFMGNKVAEYWSYVDMQTLMAQLGVDTPLSVMA